MSEIRRNISRMYAYKFLSEFYLILPILIPYFRASGLADSQVFIIQAAYTAGFLLFEIPSGYLADVIGREKTLFGGDFPVSRVCDKTGSALKPGGSSTRIIFLADFPRKRV